MNLDITRYSIRAKIRNPARIAVVADLHNGRWQEIFAEIKKNGCDIIVIPGDLTEGMRSCENGLAFLRAASSFAPTFYSIGNHEIGSREQYLPLARETGAVMLDNAYVRWHDINIGGLTTGFDTRQSFLSNTPRPNLHWLSIFSALSGYKLLLCHHPEYYPRYIRSTGIDLTISGHAHGGQWRIGGKSIFAPGQGLFPRYAQGLHEKRLCVSRGLANNTAFPRFGNNPELVFITLVPEENLHR